MKKVLVGVGLLAALVAVVYLIGRSLPVNHHATRSIQFRQPPETVWAALADQAGMPAWRAGMTAMERVADIDGHPTWKETADGMSLLIETVSEDKPRRLVRRVHDPGGDFGGTWTFDISAVPGGSRLRITEDGEVYQPIFRVVSRFMDPRKNMTLYLTGLAGKFGETPAFDD